MNGWGRRHRSVYAYDVVDYRTGQLARAAYIGKSSSDLRYRDTQHRHGKSWARAIVGPIYPLYDGECGRVRLWLLEVWFIKTRLPILNYRWNRGNPRRMPIWQQNRLYGHGGTAYRTPR